MPDVVPITPGSGTGVDTREAVINLTGTVAKNATATVTGTTTTFTTQLVAGDVIRIPGGTSTEDRTVQAIASDTSLTVTVAFTTTASGQTGQRVSQRQIVAIGDPASSLIAGVSSLGLAVAPNPLNFISTQNSTTSVLGAGATYTGTGEYVADFAVVYLSVFASHASATDGLQIQQSSNNTNWDIVDTYTIPATTGRVYAFGPAASYYRVVYTNGGTLQTTFRLQSAYHRFIGHPSSSRPSDAFTNETDTENVQAFGMVWNGTTWDRAPGSTGGVLIRPALAATSSVTRVAAAAADTPLKAANSSRLGLELYNESTATCFVKYGTGASATSYTVPMGPGAYWEMPSSGPVYTGAVNGFWSAANGAMQVTEISP